MASPELNVNKDVFVSYSTVDESIVATLLTQFEKANISFYFAPKAIYLTEDFIDSIITGISHCSYFLFIGSEHSLKSPMATRELIAAANLLPIDRLVGYIVDDMVLSPKQQFLFGHNNIWSIKNHNIEELVEFFKKAVHGSEQQIVPNAKEICVGNVLDFNGQKGIVYKLTDSNHGKAISISWGKDSWSSIAEYKAQRKPVSISHHSAAENMLNIKQYLMWHNNYPAFRWCFDLGKNWYLPATNDWKDIFAVLSKLNLKLTSLGLQEIESSSYWTSTEYNKWSAHVAELSNYNSEQPTIKTEKHLIRAIIEF